MYNSTQKTMKKIALSLICSLVAGMTLTSCLPEGEESELTSTVALLSFSINDLKTQHTITLENGKDSTYTTVMATSKLKFIIDHEKGEVYNSDSIAYGTNVTRVVTHIGADGYIAYYKDNEKVGYSQEDSIDFTHPVRFVITSYDEQYSREYRITIRKHQVDPKKTHWQQLKGANYPANLFAEQKAIIKEGQLYVFGIDSSGKGYTTSAAVNDGTQWSSPTAWTGVEQSADISSIQLIGDTFYLLAGNTLCQAADGINWEAVNTDNTLSTLLAVTTESTPTVWGISQGFFASSTDMTTWISNGQTAHEAIGRSVGTFSQPLNTNQHIHRTLFVATSTLPGDTCAQVWSKLSTEDEWTQVKPVGTNIYGCPNLEGLAVISYRGRMYAFGGKSMGNRQLPLEAFGSCYESRDNGVTWRERDDAFSLPTSFNGREDAFATTTDGEYVWVVWSKGDVWRGQWYGQ